MIQKWTKILKDKNMFQLYLSLFILENYILQKKMKFFSKPSAYFTCALFFFYPTLHNNRFEILCTMTCHVLSLTLSYWHWKKKILPLENHRTAQTGMDLRRSSGPASCGKRSLDDIIQHSVHSHIIWLKYLEIKFLVLKGPNIALCR